MRDRRSILERLGLEGYAAKAYLALLELSSGSAKDVAERGDIPKGRIYEVLEELHRRGAVELLPEAPKRYRAVPIAALYERLIRSQSDELDSLRAEREAVTRAFAVQAEPPAEAGQVVVLRDPAAIHERVGAWLGGVDEEALVAAGPLPVLRLGRWEEALRGSAARGARWRVVVPVEAASRPAAEQLRGWGADVRHDSAGEPVLLAVLDGARVLVLRGDPASREPAGAWALFLEEPPVARALGAMLGDRWREAEPLGERLAWLAAQDGGTRAATALAPRLTVRPRKKPPRRDGSRTV